MKKLLLCFCVFTLLLSCQQAKHKTVKNDWTLYRKAYALLNHQPDSAFYYFNQVTVSSKDSTQIAMAFDIMAMIQSDMGDHYGAQESLTSSLRYLDGARKQDKATLSNVYNELGVSSTNLKNYAQALVYFDQAYALTEDSTWKVTITNNKALAYQNSGNYTAALTLYRRLLPKASGLDRIRLLTNYTTTLFLKDPKYPAALPLHEALQDWLKENDKSGLNSIYLSLIAYYEKTKPDSALYYATQRLKIAQLLKSSDDQLEALTALIKNSDAHDAQRYFAIYQRLNDSVQIKRAAAKNQFALIRYNVEKRETDNVRLQKDVAVKRYQLLVAGILSIVIAAALSWHYRKRRRRLLLEQEMRMNKKVHDGVANGIYQLMSEVEHGLVRDEEELADKLDELYQRSRNISYDKPQSGNQTFDQRLSAQLRAFGGPSCHISLIGNDTGFWSLTSDLVKENLSYILQELLVNMKKHSRATNVLVKFEANERLQISYSDDGVGLPFQVKFGNGLSGTENRIQAMGGTLTFDGEPNKGLKVLISIPL